MKVGHALPALEIPVTRTLIVAGAVASRDYQDVHHDAEAAREKGSPDIFMNILTTNGLVGRYITDRLGPGARLRAVKIRLGVPNYPGDTMVLTGTVTAVAPDGTAEVRVVGANGLGRHVTGTVTVSLGVAGAGVGSGPGAGTSTGAHDDPGTGTSTSTGAHDYTGTSTSTGTGSGMPGEGL
ncbi:MaoC family dehydratase [Streptomyces agglomeratus]|uniref:MaoC family dehydratase n=1 Tax=Streptomyces agglomeratus TaxID=285458 RepID=UPI0009A09A9B|nr:MaoC family dehydratase [Streptomyces agglomeratus]